MIPSPGGDALYLNCWQRDDLVYLRESRVFQIKLAAKSALAKYLKAEKAKRMKKKDSSLAGVENDRKENVSYLGNLSELKLPKGGRVAAVSPDGSELLIGYQERDRMFFTREDLWVAKTKAIERARDPARCLRAMDNITAAFDREMMGVCWTEAGIFSDYVDGTHICLARLNE